MKLFIIKQVLKFLQRLEPYFSNGQHPNLTTLQGHRFLNKHTIRPKWDNRIKLKWSQTNKMVKDHNFCLFTQILILIAAIKISNGIRKCYFPNFVWKYFPCGLVPPELFIIGVFLFRSYSTSLRLTNPVICLEVTFQKRIFAFRCNQIIS